MKRILLRVLVAGVVMAAVVLVAVVGLLILLEPGSLDLANGPR